MVKKIIKILVRIFKIFLATTIVLFVSFVLLQRFSKNNFTVLGYRMFAVVTGSMEPVYKIGDVLLCKNVDTNTLKVGDDITYLGKEASFKDKVITHRIKKIEKKNGEKIYYTQGIATNSIDPPIKSDQIYGKVDRKMVVLSFFHHYSSGNMGFFFFVLIPLMLLIGTEVVQTMLEKYEKKNKQQIDGKENQTNQQPQQVVAQNTQQPVNQPTEAELQQELQALQQQAAVQNSAQPVAQPTEAELQQELQALQQQVAVQNSTQPVVQPTEAELQQELQELQQQVAAQKTTQPVAQPTEAELQQELQALQQQVAAQNPQQTQ